MAKVEIVESLFEEIEKTFKGRATLVFDLMEDLAEHPHKGKPLGAVGAMVVKEIRFEGFRLHFITDGHALKFLDEAQLVELLIRFVRMSDKKRQQQTIDEIKQVLRMIGPKGFS
jgi:hypothetical protein